MTEKAGQGTERNGTGPVNNATEIIYDINGIKYEKCLYGTCMLPEHNYYYIAQIVYLLFCSVMLFINFQQVTFLPIFMFVTPLLMDILFTKLKSKWFIVGQAIFAAIIIILLIFCLAGGLGHAIEDKGDLFEFSSVVFANNKLEIHKRLIVYILAGQISVPVYLMIGNPTKKTKPIVQAFTMKQEVNNPNTGLGVAGEGGGK